MESNKIFIPMSIDQNSVDRGSYFFSPMKLFFMVGGFIPGIPWVMYAYTSSGDNFYGLLLGIVTFLIAQSYLVRFVVFEERRLKRLLKTLDDNKRSKIDHFWGIDEIEDDGVIRYKYSLGLRKAVIVKVVRGSTVGVPSDFRDRYKQCNLMFSRDLLNQQFGYMKYTKLEKKELPSGLKDYNERVSKIKDPNVKRVLLLNLKTISNFTKDYKSVLVDYYVVSASNPKLLNTFRSVVHDAMTKAYGNEVYFRGTKILDADEVVSFMGDVLNVKGINRDGYQEIEDYRFEEFGKVARAFDGDGREVMLDLENTLESDILKAGRGPSLSSLYAELENEKLLSDKDDDSEGSGDKEFDEVLFVNNSSEVNRRDEEYIFVEDDADLSKYDSDEYEIVYVDEEDEDEDEDEVDEDEDLSKYMSVKK